MKEKETFKKVSEAKGGKEPEAPVIYENLPEAEQVAIIEAAYGRRLGRKERGHEVIRFTRIFQKLRDMDQIRTKPRPGVEELKKLKPKPEPPKAPGTTDALQPRLPERPAGDDPTWRGRV